ncbi:CotY/CotZ family spore coat protein [Bacillus sp. T33-2]|uniref:CotY/CotZ family spore coat protein n=1 Tax=Bacillus sp. T33-2 TaxID=2054168 RepID=UPI000C78939A|nr:CotY/CotZ family spore coat protein [Bacillus sp. T33-2]PLR98824.1 hypothetical protein CVD19_04100 [Bacillus sp. T33-2]
MLRRDQFDDQTNIAGAGFRNRRIAGAGTDNNQVLSAFNRCSVRGGSKKKEDCVCETVREIANNQAIVEGLANNDCCDVSCGRSLEALVSPATQNNMFDTVPFMLFEKGAAIPGLIPFFGWGVSRGRSNGTVCSTPFTSPFFRVKKFVDGSDCCAVLELLCPVFCDDNDIENVGAIETFTRTGACFEVDLRDFKAITCFPPTNAIEDSCVCDIITIIVALLLGPLGFAGTPCEVESSPLINALRNQLAKRFNQFIPLFNQE